MSEFDSLDMKSQEATTGMRRKWREIKPPAGNTFIQIEADGKEAVFISRKYWMRR
ncbi:MAG: hypothetical protein LUI39_14685 [Lachnospiraceae bacterium]|nr:hypothetical protein [Lachnospiraceae bacterium]